jgi:hypothetical protein
VVGEGGEQSGDEGVAGDVAEDGALMAHVVNLLQLDDLGLAEDLEGVDLGRGLLVQRRGRIGRPDEADAGECAYRG